MVIILSSAETDQVRGPSHEAPGLASLQPIALLDGTFYLGVETLSDPNFAEHRAMLAALPQVEFGSIQALVPPPE
jgi:hypothetical protein